MGYQPKKYHIVYLMVGHADTVYVIITVMNMTEAVVRVV